MPPPVADAAATGGGGAVAGLRHRGPAPATAASPPPPPPPRPAGLSRLLVGVLSTVTWMLFSSAVIILNKGLYSSGFEYPSTVTGVGQLFSAASGFLLAAVAGQPLRRPPPLRVFVRALLPIAACTAGSMYFGNMAYLYLSVSFIQILKAFTPAITLALCVAAGLELPSPPLLVAIAMIVGGTAGAVLVESGAPSFRLVGFAAFMASSLTEAARVVGAELLRDGSKYNTAESLVYIGGPTAALLLAVAAVREWPAAAAAAASGRGFALVAAAPGTFLAAPLVSALVNMSCFFAINATSSLTFKVAGCVKNVAVVAYGVVAHGDAITPLQVAGYAVSVVGFSLYSQLKMAPSAAKGGKGKAPPQLCRTAGSGGQAQAQAQSPAGLAVTAAAGAAAAAGADGVAASSEGASAGAGGKVKRV